MQEDWCAWLPAAKSRVYRTYTEQLEIAYNIFSVALNDALEFRRIGRAKMAAEAVGVTPDLCKRLAGPLAAVLRALGQHARHYGNMPNTAPLSPANFQGARGQRTARMNDLLSRVLLTQRSQFLHKISALEEMVTCLEEDFRGAAEEIGFGVSLRPDADWHLVDTVHYDLNTCLREAVILLKSFLVTVPEDQLRVFQETVQTQMRAVEPPSQTHSPVQTRRMAASGGK